MTLEMLEKFIAPLKRRVLQSISRALITAIADGSGLQKLQVELLADELHGDVDRVQNYGFTSAPQPGAEGVFLSVGGAREHGVVIAVDDRRYRIKNLQPGEVCMYTDEGDTIKFKRGNKIEITGAAEVKIISAAKVVIEAPDAEINCDNAKITASAKVEATAPEMTLTAATKIDALTPLLNVSGIVACSGIATGGAAAVPGDAVLSGNLKALGTVEDGNGTMDEMRTTYNSHTHAENGTGGGTTNPPDQPMT